MTVHEALLDLERSNSTSDPVRIDGESLPVRLLRQHVDPEMPADEVPIGFYADKRDPSSWTTGTLADMVRERRR